MRKCAAFIIFLSLVAACKLTQTRVPVDAPQDAKDSAIEVIKNSGECRVAVRCTDFKIICSNPIELEARDKANGVTQKWCLRISYSYDYQGKRYDGPTDALLQYDHGEWGVDFLYHQNRHCGCKSD